MTSDDIPPSPRTPAAVRRPLSFWIGRLLPVAAVILVVLTISRQRELESWRSSPVERVVPRRLAPRFELADHRRHVVKLEGLLGRHRVIVVFFDAQLGADRDPRLQRLIACETVLQVAGIEVVAISSATPYANQQIEERRGSKFPFPLLTDIDIRSPIPHPVHRLWGCFDETANRTTTGLFLIERDGTIPADEEGKPIPVQDERSVLDLICSRQWPE